MRYYYVLAEYQHLLGKLTRYSSASSRPLLVPKSETCLLQERSRLIARRSLPRPSLPSFHRAFSNAFIPRRHTAAPTPLQNPRLLQARAEWLLDTVRVASRPDFPNHSPPRTLASHHFNRGAAREQALTGHTSRSQPWIGAGYDSTAFKPPSPAT